jgi:hypothetical protein
MLQDPGGRVGAQQIERADYVGFQSLDPSQLRPALKPGHLALEVRKEVAVQPDAARHAVGSARPRVALEPPSNPIDDLMQILDGDLAKIAGLDLVPGRPGLSPLPLLGGGELRHRLEFAHVLVEKDTRRSRDLQASLGGLRPQSAPQVGWQVDAERTHALRLDSGFHYHALYHDGGAV